MVLITPTEIHFALRTLQARREWIKDNDDESEEENELKSIVTLIKKLNCLEYDLTLSG